MHVFFIQLMYLYKNYIGKDRESVRWLVSKYSSPNSAICSGNFSLIPEKHKDERRYPTPQSHFLSFTCES